jgi:hypothetical protein
LYCLLIELAADRVDLSAVLLAEEDDVISWIPGQAVDFARVNQSPDKVEHVETFIGLQNSIRL